MKHNWLIITLLSILLAACTNHNIEGSATTDTIVDDYGRAIAVPHNPQRIVSLSPSVTEILFALHADKLLVGRTDFCTYPDECTAIPSIGGISNLSIESIVSRTPDLVISGSMVSSKNAEQLDALGIPMICIVEKPHFEALFDNIASIARLVDRQHEADSLISLLKTQLSELDTTTGTPHTCYYVVGFGAGGNFTAGGNTFINDIITMAGGRNIAEDVSGWSYSLEALLDADPEYIIIRQEDSARFVNTRPYTNLSAVKNGRIIGLNSGMIDLQVPRNIDVIKIIRSRMNK